VAPPNGSVPPSGHAGRVALVTGAGSGMGRLAAWRLAAAGTTVVAVDVDEVALGRAARHAPQIRPHVLDVRDAAAVAGLVDEVEATIGPIDRLVAAAAIAPAGAIVDQPIDDVVRVMEVNYAGLVTVVKAVLGPMLGRDRGDVVVFGSLAGWLPSRRLSAYSASKAAVVSFAETLAHELRGTSLRVVCTCPPPVDTPMIDQVAGHGPSGITDRPLLRPEVVLDDLEDALASGRVLTFPGRGTSTIWRLRRLAPGLLWRRIDAIEEQS
jgi:NAD(P)-dependent dehydrogenase (short-subunit alcohol dehydrogenase family)